MLLERLPDGTRGRRGLRAVDGRACAREPRRAARPSRRPTSPSSSWTSRWTRSSRTPSSTGCRPRAAVRAPVRARCGPGGRLVAQCGGEGNVERFHEVARRGGGRAEPFAEHLAGWTRPWNFAGAEETAARLQRAGFERVECGLEPWPVTPDEPAAYLRSVCLGPHLERLPEELRDAYVARRGRALRRRARLRAAEHRRQEARVSQDRDAARRRHRARDHGRRARAARRARRLRARRAARSAAPRSTPTAARSPTRCSTPAATPTPCCSRRWAARSGTRPTPARRAPSRACSACARSSACSPTCARSGRARRCSTPARSSASASRAPTCWWCASSRAASTSASAAASDGARLRHLRLQRGRDRAHRAGGLRERAAQGHERGQGQHPRHLAPLARGHRARGRRLPAASSSSTCWWTTPPCSSSRARPTST